MEVTKGDDRLCRVRMETGCENLEELRRRLHKHGAQPFPKFFQVLTPGDSCGKGLW